jgi:hypothetical protein
MVKARLHSGNIFRYDKDVIAKIDANSPFAKIYNTFKDVEENNSGVHNVQRLFKRFATTAPTSPDTLIAQYQDELDKVNDRYTMLKYVSHYSPKPSELAAYINMVDATKGI